MRTLILSLCLALSGATYALADGGDHEDAAQAAARFQTIQDSFYEGNTLQSPEKFKDTYAGLNQEDQAFCARVCTFASTQHNGFCSQFNQVHAAK